MFDLFNRKRVRELEALLQNRDDNLEGQAQFIMKLQREDKAHITNLQSITGSTQSQLTVAKNQIEYLVRTIRQMDDQIFAMSQCSDWPQMRPHFNTLSDGMIARKHAESERIGDLLRPELIKTYNAENNAKRAYENAERAYNAQLNRKPELLGDKPTEENPKRISSRNSPFEPNS